MNNLDDYILGKNDISSVLIKGENSKINLTEHANIKDFIKKRARDSHKGTYGRVGFLCGSKGMAGACILNLNAALRSGSGLVKGCVTNSIYTIVDSMSLEAITYSFDEQNLSFSDLNRELIQFSDVIATGSGCANMRNYKNILDFIIKSASQTLVIDAEGINQLNLEMLKNHKQNIVLTPHYGEFANLLKKDVAYVRKDVIDKATEFSNKYNVYLILKGARTIVCCPDGYAYVNTTGNPGMATAGSGDVLTGIVASFIGQKINIINALRLSVYLHGLAGDIGSSHVGEYSLIAGDIIKYLPEAIQKTIH